MSKLPATVQNLVANLEDAKTRVSAEVGDMPFLRLLKDGMWVYGADDIEVEGDSEWAINPNSLATGFAAWGKGTLEGEEMALISDRPIVKADLDDVGFPWKPQIAFQMVCIKGEDEGQSVLYKTTSVGGSKAFKLIIDAILGQTKSDPENIVPIVALDMDSYKHKEHGKVYTPIFDIVEWAPIDGLPTGDEEADEQEPEEREASASADDDIEDAEYEEVQEEEEEKPRSRRSRSSKNEEKKEAKADKPARRSRRSRSK